MKRSPGVTAAAVTLIVLGSFALLEAVLMVSIALMMRAIQPKVAPAVTPVLLIMGVVFLLIGGWGIASGIGLLRLRPWGRISALVIAALLICVALPGLYRVPHLIRATTGIPTVTAVPGMIASEYVGMAIVTVLPLALGLWWLLLLTRKRVRAQFAAGSAAALASASPDAEIPSPLAVPPLASESSAPKIPTSVLVIAIFLLAGGAIGLLGLPLIVHMHQPSMILGMLVTGWKLWLASALMLAAELIFGIALLRKQSWAIDATMAFVIFTVLNSLLFVISPARNAFLALIFQHYPMPAMASDPIFHHFMDILINGGFVLSVILSLVALYFLFTRRRAYRAVCALRAPAFPGASS